MKASLLHKLESLSERYEEIGHLLSDPEVINDQNKFRQLSREYSELESLAQTFGRYQQAQADLDEADLLANDSDPDMRAMGEEEQHAAKAQLEALSGELEILLLPK
ncbi:PCRF domain-containing protein, partial [Gilvimarinus sp. 1_MG-2023]